MPLVNFSVQHFRSTNAAILLKATPPPQGAENVGKTKWYMVLAFVHPDIISGKLGERNCLVLYR